MQQVEILIRCHISSAWSDWLEGLTVAYSENGETILTGQIPDQPALYGILNRLSDLGMQLISVSAGGVKNAT